MIKISKKGLVTKDGIYGRDVLFRNGIPVFITPSLLEVLKTFGENIELLEATGSKEIQNNPIPLENLGVFISTIMENKCIIKYDKSLGSISKHDDLTPVNIQRIVRAIEQNKILDCAVTKLKIRIQDQHLKDVISEIYPRYQPSSNIFYADFVSANCESDLDTNLWDATPCNKTLLDYGFKKTLLHCVKLIDDGQASNSKLFYIGKRPRRFYYINWEPTNKEIELSAEQEFMHKSPLEIAHALMDNFRDYGYVKKYSMGSENKLLLVSMS
jgi:hypothetical protein